MTWWAGDLRAVLLRYWAEGFWNFLESPQCLVRWSQGPLRHMVALPKSSGEVTLVESLVSCLQPPLPQPPSTTQPPSCLPLATMAKHGSRTHEVEPTLSQCQQDMLCPREILFPHLSLSPKVVPWHFQAPAISYSTSTLLLHFQR